MTDTPTLLQQYEPQAAEVIVADPQVLEARFSASGRLLAGAGYDGRIRIWDVSGDKAVESPAITGHHGWVHSVVFHPTEHLLFSADSWGQIRATRIGAEAEALWQQTDAHDGWIRQLDISPDGQLLASCAMDGRVALWSTADGRRLGEFREHGCDVQSVRFHPSGQWLASGDGLGKVRIWNVAERRLQTEMDASSLYLLHRLQDVGGVRLIRFHPDGTRMGCGGVTPKNGATVQGEPTLLVFDFPAGKMVQRLSFGEAKDCFLHDVTWQADGVLMAVTSGTPGTGKVVFRRLEDDKPFYETTKLPNCHSLSFSYAGRRLAVVTTNRNSNGNGRRLNADGQYPGNNSPIHLFHVGSRTA
ncbi:MAG: WD40 repeat domain-containing protein [Pirellulaceae bacterium]